MFGTRMVHDMNVHKIFQPCCALFTHSFLILVRLLKNNILKNKYSEAQKSSVAYEAIKIQFAYLLNPSNLTGISYNLCRLQANSSWGSSKFLL